MKVYLISSEINNSILYKIGITKREVVERLRELRTGNPGELSIVEVFESKWATKIETNLHNRFQTNNIHLEWFCLNEDNVKNFKKDCQMIHDNFEILNQNNTWFIEKITKQNERKNRK